MGGYRHGCAVALAVAAALAQAAQAQAPAEARGAVLEEVVVTAHKEAQDLGRAPSAITAIAGEELVAFGVHDLHAVQNLVPSARFQEESASTEIYIRGVGSTLDLPMIEPPTGYNLNGVPIPREVSTATLFDLAQIEVLPGPQGTLYGRSALGGAVNAATSRPGRENSTSAIGEFGNYSQARLTLSQDWRPDDRLGVRAVANGAYRDGFLSSGAQAADDVGGRLSAVYEPSDRLTVFAWAQHETKRGSAANFLNKPYLVPGDPWDDSRSGAAAPLGSPRAEGKDWRATIVGGQLDYRLGDNVTVSWIPGFVDFTWQQRYWLGSKPTDFGEDIRQHTHELRLAGAQGPLKWLAGLYASRLETSGQFYIQFPFGWLNASDIRAHRLDGYAAFGQATYSFTDRLRLVAGARYSTDRRTASGFSPGLIPAPDPARVNTPAFSNRATWTDVDWKAGVEFDVAERSLLYANVQTGSQPGTFDSFPGAVTRAPNLLAVTAGSKNRLLDGRLRIDDEAFHYVYENLLVQAFDAGSGALRLANAQKVVIYGNQLDVSLLVGNATTISTGVSYLHARNREFVIPAGTFNGLQLQNAPDWTVNVALRHDFALGNGARLRGEVRSRYEDRYWGDFSHSPGLYQSSYVKTDVALTYLAPSGRWSVALWARNLENQDVQGAAAPASDPGPGGLFIEPPRTYGVRLQYDFDR